MKPFSLGMYRIYIFEIRPAPDSVMAAPLLCVHTVALTHVRISVC